LHVIELKCDFLKRAYISGQMKYIAVYPKGVVVAVVIVKPFEVEKLDTMSVIVKTIRLMK